MPLVDWNPSEVFERAQTLRALDRTTAVIDRPLESVHWKYTLDRATS
jgi:hypothetical protein